MKTKVKPKVNMRFNARAVDRMFENRLVKPVLVLLALVVLCSHDLYLKMETYFLKPDQEAVLRLYNGTFENSENTIARDRMLDASIVAQGERVSIEPDQWNDLDGTVTQLTFTTGDEGTYVAGVSTKARNIELSAEKFNEYLEHDGVSDMLELRRENSLLDQDAIESYQKHVKAIYQVGDVRSDDWKTELGYPIEFVPQSNPYEKYSGESLEVKLFLDGEPLPNQLVYADYIGTAHSHEHEGEAHSHDHGDSDHEHGEHEHDHEHGGHEHDGEAQSHEHEHDGEAHSHDHGDSDHEHGEHEHDGEAHSHEHESHTHKTGQQLRTNEQGIVAVNLPKDGIYYLRTIHMESVTDSEELTHRSKWATLTFEVTHKHDSSTHTHDDHDHDDEGISTWVFILGSLLVIGLLFVFFRRKN